MAFSQLNFERDWTNPSDFASFETDEDTVRADYQYHPDAIKKYINTVLLPALIAGNIPFETSTAVPATNVQAAIEKVHEQITSIVVGDLPDESIDTKQLAPGAVKQDQIYAGAVVKGKLGTGAVTTNNIDGGAVTESKIGGGAVTETKLGPGAVNLATKVSGVLPAANGGTGVASLIDLWCKLATLSSYSDATTPRYLPQNAGGTGKGTMVAAIIEALSGLIDANTLSLGDGRLSVGKIILKSGVSYGTELPKKSDGTYDGVEGQLFFVKV